MKISQIIKNAMWIVCIGLFLAHVAVGEDAYTELKEEVQNGMKISLLGDKNPVVKLESKIKTKKISEEEALEWVRNIVKSPSVKTDIEVYDKSQLLIIEAFFTIYRKHGSPDSLRIDMETFYIKHLRSPNNELKKRGFYLMGTKMKKELETIPKDVFKEVLAFAKAHPTYGTNDNNDDPFYNIMFKLACCGKHTESINWLESISGKYPDYEISRQIALIRMGEKKYEKQLIDKYYKSPTGREKFNLAIALAYASSKETLKVLALELRNDELYGSQMGGFNQRVLSALIRSRDWDIELSKTCLFNQEDFDKAEEWCQKEFNTKWDRPKPPVRLPEMRKF